MTQKRHLVVLSDGTWQGPENETNIWRLRQGLARSAADGGAQLSRYDPGVGAVRSRLQRITQGTVGSGLSDNVLELYRWLSEQYREGDAIYLFGFSRGAFTVRSLAGFIGYAGLLRFAEIEHLDEVFRLFKRPDRGRNETLRQGPAEGRSLDAIKRPVPIRFVGVFDTVGALGVPPGLRVLRRLPRRNIVAFNRLVFDAGFHDTRLSPLVDIAVHALAVDEQRVVFRPTFWTTGPASAQQRAKALSDLPAPPGGWQDQIIRQVWFAGWHSDIGGGSGKAQEEDARRGQRLSTGVLRWMVEQAEAAGLVFEPAWKSEMLDAEAPAHQWWRGRIHRPAQSWLSKAIDAVFPQPLVPRAIGNDQRRERRTTPLAQSDDREDVAVEEVHPSVELRTTTNPPLDPPYRPVNLP